MSSTSILDILKHPNDNGIIVFVLGILFILSIYHFLLYFQNRDKTYLYYSLYTFLMFIGHLHEPPNSFIKTLFEPYAEFLLFINLPVMWLYNTVYFVFVFSFIELKSYLPKWNTIVKKTIAILFIFILIVLIVSLFANKIEYTYYVNGYIVPFFFLFGIFGYYLFYKIKNSFKYYIVYGTLVLYISSFAAFYTHRYGFFIDNDINFSIFYIGLIIENLLFSLGLGQKQKLILQEKNKSQEKLIIQLKENEKLKSTIQLQLERDVALLNEQSKNYQLEKSKAKSDKELAELKMSSLRSQMNPHFIFNSLNAIKLYIIDSEKENAVYYLNKFSKLIRKILATTREKEISLADELETLKLYIDIENIRFNNEIEATFTIDENLSLDTIKIPSLIFQPFIENAIWHGLSPKKGLKKINIALEKEKNTHVKILISDNGIGRKKSAEIKENKIHKKDSVGIKLTEERLVNFTKVYKNSYSLVFNDLIDSSKKAIGTTVILKIPLI